MMRLNYKRFGTTVTSSAWETGADAANNLSYVYATFTQKAASNTYNQSGSAYYNISCDGKSTGNVSYKFAKGSTVTYSATLGPYYHAADGSLGNKTVTIVVHGDVNNGNHTQNVTVSFTKFARGFSSIPTLTLTSRNSSMFSFDWRTSEAASDVYYDLYNSAGTLLRSERIGGNGASVGSFQLSGLSSNTTYKVRVRAVRQDSGLSDNGTSATGSYTTYIQPTLTVSLVSRTETSLKIKATPNTAVASKSWTLNLNNVTVKTSTSTAETVEFTGLSANKTYQIVVSYVSTAANGSLPSESAVQNYATYAYPYLKSISVNPLTIGNQQTVTLYNPLGRTMTVYMNKTNTSGALLYNGTTSVAGENATFSFTPNATTLYNNFPSGSDVTCVYYSKYNNTQYGTAQTGKYKLIGTEKPTFPATSWSYSADLTSLTNNNQVVIDNYSTVTATLNTAATSNYGTGVTMSKYEFTWNTTQQLSGTTTGSTASIAQGTGSTISMSTTDSRGLSQIAQKNLVSGTTYIPYVAPTISKITTHRTDGIQTETKLSLEGSFYATNFGGSTGSHTNTLYSAKYYTKTSGSSTWSSAYDIPISNFTINTSTGAFSLTDFQIHANGSSGGFAVGTRYDIKIEVKDAKGLLATATNTNTVTDGKIARDVYQDSNGEYHEGINGRADSNYTQKINGSLNVTKTSTNYNGGAIPGTKQANATTVGGLLDEVRMTNGQMGSVTINTAYTSNNITIATGWYNYLYIPHRSGGSSGSASGDNCNYGNLILVGMTSDTPVYLVRKASDTTQVSKLSKNFVKAAVSAKAHTDYNNNQDYLPTMNFLTYWNGAYNSSNASNLTYCTKGAFGDACIKAVTSSATSGGTGLITSGGVYSAINGKIIDSSDGNSLRFQNGTQISWGAFNTGANSRTATYTKAFKSNPTLVVSCDDANTSYAHLAQATTTTTKATATAFYIPVGGSLTLDPNVNIKYVAIGVWK